MEVPSIHIEGLIAHHNKSHSGLTCVCFTRSFPIQGSVVMHDFILVCKLPTLTLSRDTLISSYLVLISGTSLYPMVSLVPRPPTHLIAFESEGGSGNY